MNLGRLWAYWGRLVSPFLFLLGVIYCEELFLKLYCFRSLTVEGAFFTLLFTTPMALLLGLLCGGVSLQRGRILLPICTALVSLWVGSQLVYYHMFRAFLTISLSQKWLWWPSLSEKWQWAMCWPTGSPLR